MKDADATICLYWLRQDRMAMDEIKKRCRERFLVIGRCALGARIERNLSVREVARRMKFTPMYISDLERGKRAWSERLVKAYVKALNKKGRKP